MTDAAAFIRAHLPVVPVPLVPEIRLHRAHPSSGLRRLTEDGDRDSRSPYWAYFWPGGLALARHVLDHPELVAGRRVLDIGAGSGLVAIAAAKAGAGPVVASETDPKALAALRLNAEANGVDLAIVGDDLTAGEPPEVDLVLAGDVFYDCQVAGRMTGFLVRCRAAGSDVLIGDPGRAFLPLPRLRRIAEYPVTEVGGSPGGPSVLGAVFSFGTDLANPLTENI